MSNKCSTDQRFIRKRNTTYKIGSLIETTFLFSMQANDIWETKGCNNTISVSCMYNRTNVQCTSAFYLGTYDRFFIVPHLVVPRKLD